MNAFTQDEVFAEFANANNEGKLDMFEEAHERMTKAESRVAELEAQLLRVTDKLDHICRFCDDGFVGNEEWEIIADARQALKCETS